MFTLRIRSAVDAVAAAMGLLEMIPEDSLCLIFPTVPLALRVDVPRCAEDVEAFAVRMRALAATYDLTAPVAVVFSTSSGASTAARCSARVSAIAGVLRTFASVYACHSGELVNVAASPLPGT